MKYVKLFENWLNEAEGAKPFDPSNPGATLVVDLTPKDVFKDAKTAAATIESIINKAVAKKDRDDVPKEYKIEIFTFDGLGKGSKYTGSDYLANRILTGKTQDDPQYLPITSSDGTKYYLKMTLASSSSGFVFGYLIDMAQENTPFFIVSKDSEKIGEDGISKKYNDRPIIRMEEGPEKYIIGVNGDLTSWEKYSGIDNMESIEFSFFSDSTMSGGGSGNAPCKLSRLIAKFGDSSSKSKMTDLGYASVKSLKLNNMQSIAQFFGYEIPDNYTPGQGVEKTKA